MEMDFDEVLQQATKKPTNDQQWFGFCTFGCPMHKGALKPFGGVWEDLFSKHC